MSTATLSDKDLRIQATVVRQLAILRRLDCDPLIDAAAVRVAVEDRNVTLTGHVETYAGKLAAERAARRVHGVRAVENDIDVRF